MIKLSKLEQFCQAYWAGAIIALLEHWKPDHKISLVEAIVHFHAIKELIGPTTWALLKTRQSSQQYVRMYEALTYQPMLPKSMIGGAREFMFGYYSIARRERHRVKANGERAQDIDIIKHYLESQ